ncbi:MAG: hypothetical protein S4CHLAM7_08670 [Chlamydiae bacterium]|nr:hypothetical protein [Chlamydiota bacterium]
MNQLIINHQYFIFNHQFFKLKRCFAMSASFSLTNLPRGVTLQQFQENWPNLNLLRFDQDQAKKKSVLWSDL